MLKRYYSIEEAAEFLTKESGQKINRMDVMILSMLGDIRLCAWVDEEFRLFELIGDPKYNSADLMYSYPFKGYIQIPKNVITPSGGEVTFSPNHAIEVIIYDGPPIGEVSDPYFIDSIQSNCDHALIVSEDLLNLKSKKVALEKQFTTTERNSLLTIIGMMAKYGYKNDLSKPYVLAKKIQADAELLGITISDDTIANKLRDAKTILDERSE